MLRITKLTDYAIIILGQMASVHGAIHTAADLAVTTGIAWPTVSKVLKSLARAQVLNSTRGAKGGYQLALAPEAITIARIIAALEGPIALTECGVAHFQCEQADTCQVQGNWSVLNRAIQSALEAVTLADMIRPMTQAPNGFHIPLSHISTQLRRITE